MLYEKIHVPTTGEAITVNPDGTINVPERPIIPYIVGDRSPEAFGKENRNYGDGPEQLFETRRLRGREPSAGKLRQRSKTSRH